MVGLVRSPLPAIQTPLDVRGDASSRGEPTPLLPTPGLLFGVSGSAPTYAAELALRYKRLPYKRADLLPGRHAKTLRGKGFAGITVPALRLGDERLQTNRAIARRLDLLLPEPALFPAEPVARAEVEAAERLGDEHLQPATRRILIWAMARNPGSVRAHPEIGRILLPRNRLLRTLPARYAFRYYGITAEVVREDLASLPGMLEAIDAYIGAGVLNGPDLNAADFQIAPLIAVLLGIGEVSADLAGRPAAALVPRVLHQ
jgi:glutathione S-transferase